jgi:hypothetical protein
MTSIWTGERVRLRDGGPALGHHQARSPTGGEMLAPAGVLPIAWWRPRLAECRTSRRRPGVPKRP